MKLLKKNYTLVSKTHLSFNSENKANLILNGPQLAEHNALYDLAEEKQSTVAEVNHDPYTPRLMLDRLICGRQISIELDGLGCIEFVTFKHVSLEVMEYLLRVENKHAHQN